ncbi:MAG: hypothetical protein ABI742_08190 [Gemmatimonadota bacterium]
MPTQSGNPLIRAALLGTILQVAMVVLGHSSPAVTQLFPIVGTGIGGLAGVLAGAWSPERSIGRAAGQGGVAGGAGALLGTIISNLLGDVPLSIIAIGTGASAGAGAIGAIVGRMMRVRAPG